MKNKSDDMKQTFDTIQERFIISQTGRVFINVNETEVQVDETDFEGNIKKVKKYEYDTDSVMVNNVTESNILAALKSKKKKESLDLMYSYIQENMIMPESKNETSGLSQKEMF